VPASVERSTHVLLSSLALILLHWQWQPITDVAWDVRNAAGRTLLWALFWLGWVFVLISTFLISHFELFGLRQVYLNLKGQEDTFPALCAELAGSAAKRAVNRAAADVSTATHRHSP